MGLILRGLLRFWKPILTGLSSILAWESVDEVVAPEEKSAKIGVLTIISSVLLLFVVGLFTGVIKLKAKKGKR